MKFKGIALALAASLVAPAFGQAKISFKGSDTLGTKMVPSLTETYTQLGNNVKFEVAAEGSSQAFSALLDGTAEIGMSSHTRNETSGTYKTFQKLAMSKKDYVSSSSKMAGNPQIVQGVQSNANGIGYVGLAFLKSEGITPVTVDGVKADPEFKESYPLSRNLYYYTIGTPKGESKKFLDWATTSAIAGRVITKVGFIPAN